jgi:hypothetical protein
MSATRYYQVLNAPSTVRVPAADPMLVKRLRRLRQPAARDPPGARVSTP